MLARVTTNLLCGMSAFQGRRFSPPLGATDAVYICPHNSAPVALSTATRSNAHAQSLCYSGDSPWCTDAPTRSSLSLD